MKNHSVESTQTEKSPKKKRRVIGIIGNVLLWLFILFSVVITVFAFSAQSNSDGVPTIGGKVISPVLTPSMEPTIKKGDIILSRVLTEEEKNNLQVNQIISYKADLDGDGTPEVNTHRIVRVITGENGYIEYKTKGDNNLAEDNFNVRPADIISVFDENKDTRIPLLGSVISFLLTSTGFFIVIVIPLIIFFLVEIVLFVRKLIEVKNAGKKQITAEDEELIKQRAIEEYIRSQQAQNASESNDASSNGTEEKAEDETKPDDEPKLDDTDGK